MPPLNETPSETPYDTIGKSYATARKTDPLIASEIHKHLKKTDFILNIGAGTGSYEPENQPVFSVEPSMKMIKQRSDSSARVWQAKAEALPFANQTFNCAITILSMHHWMDKKAAFNEIKRVTKDRFIAVTWNPTSAPYWLTRDYFPEIHSIDQAIFPSCDELAEHFPAIQFHPLTIPRLCQDGFTAAYWARPHAYLDPSIRNSMSTFSKIKHLNHGLNELEKDLKSGHWKKQNSHLLHKNNLDVGYVVAVWDVPRK